jgi:hypothetical protein
MVGWDRPWSGFIYLPPLLNSPRGAEEKREQPVTVLCLRTFFLIGNFSNMTQECWCGCREAAARTGDQCRVLLNRHLGERAFVGSVSVTMKDCRAERQTRREDGAPSTAANPDRKGLFPQSCSRLHPAEIENLDMSSSLSAVAY